MQVQPVVEKLNGLDLFSGGGWFAEAMAPWFRPAAYCEVEHFSQRVLLSRMSRGEIPQAPIWDDVRTLRGGMLPMPIHCIWGGFPCQGHSLAGARKRMADSRSALFWEIIRLAEETKAPFLFLENVWPGIRRSLPTIRAAIESLGYKVRDGHLSASNVGLPHRRERWFLLAYSSREGRRLQPRRREGACGPQAIWTGPDVEARPFANANETGRETGGIQGGFESELPALDRALESDDWDAVARLFCGMDHGHPYRGKRIGTLGNSVPWIQYRTAFQRLMGLA